MEISVLEVGLGTGLNALLTYHEAVRRHAAIHYTAIEKSPLPASVYQELEYAGQLEKQELDAVFRQIHAQKTFSVSDQKMAFHFRKLVTDIHALESIPGPQDLVYYDAFAPSSQEDMWDAELLEKISNALNPGGILVTYCAKGQFRRDLQSLGLRVERIPGPPGKREMIRATK